MKTVVFIETNFSGLEAIQYCVDKGYRVVLVSDSFERFRKWFPAESLKKLELADQIVSVNDSSDPEEVLRALRDNVGKIDALLTFAEIRTLTAARLCQRLGLRGANPDAIEIAQDKFLFRQVLLGQGVDDVQCVKLEGHENPAVIADQVTFPCFVKPVSGHSSVGARTCHGPEDILTVIEMLKANTDKWISEAVVVETLLQGELVSVEILTTGPGQHQVVGVADRDTENGSIETGSSFPLSNADLQVVADKACAALDAIGYDFGASHVEMMVADNGPHLVEANTRVGGSGHSVMLDLATARSIVGDCVELCLGQLEKAPKLYNHVQGAAWKCFTSEAVGEITYLPEKSTIGALPGVREVWYHRQVGDHLDGLKCNFDWVVQVMCVGADQGEAKRNASEAIAYVARHAVIGEGVAS